MKARALLPVLLTVGSFAHAWPTPQIPREEIPASMPPEVKRYVLALYDGRDEVQIAAANALGELGAQASSAAPFLASLLRDPVRHGMVGWSSAGALKRIGEAAIEPTILAVQFGSSYMRMRALSVLKVVSNERTIPVLVSIIVDNRRSSGGDAREVLQTLGEPALDYLLKSLDDPNVEIRRGALFALSAFPRSNVIERVSGFLTGEDAELKDAALESLVQVTKARNAVPLPLNDNMRAALRDPDPLVRLQAIRLVAGTEGEGKMAALADMVHDTDRNVRMAAIQTIGEIGSDEAVESLLGLLNSADDWVRGLVAERLGAMKEARALPRLLALARDKSQFVREKAIAALSGMDAADSLPIFLDAVRDEDAMVRTSAARGLGSIRDPRVVPALAGALADPDKGVRTEAVMSLRVLYVGKLKVSAGNERTLPPNDALPLYAPAVRDALVTALQDGTEVVRQHAVDALMDPGSPQVTDVAYRLLSDPDRDVQIRALDYLARFPDLPDLAPLRQLLSDEDYHVRCRAATILATRGDRQSFNALLSLLDDPRCVGAVAPALKGFGEDAIEPLARVMRSQGGELPVRVACSLMEIGSPRAQKVLADALNDDNPAVRAAASYAFSRAPRVSKTPEVLAAIMRERIDDWRDRTATELVQLGAPAVPGVAALLRDEDPRVRCAAIDVLRQIGDAAASRALAGALRDPDPLVREAVVKALADVGGPGAAKSIRALMSDSDPGVRETAMAALARASPGEAVPALEALGTDPDWHMRSAAIRSLAELKELKDPKPVEEALNDEQWQVRQAAAAALGRCGVTSAVPVLAAALDDEHWLVRRGALASLKSLTGADVNGGAAEWRAWWEARRREDGTAAGPASSEGGP
jgi:HEAT repeat protein